MKTLAMAFMVTAGIAQAQEIVRYDYPGSFDDASFALETAILDRGLVIDYVAHPGAMLSRTAADVGSSVKLFDAADAYQFCSAALSRKVMEIDAGNIAYCPWSIFVTDQEGAVIIGYRSFPPGEMQEVQLFLDDIVQEALAF